MNLLGKTWMRILRDDENERDGNGGRVGRREERGGSDK